eukprot:8112847-Pyramimonas_sp.AAC.1
MLVLFAGAGGMSHFACKRKLTSGGHLDKRANVDLGHSRVPPAVEHYVHAWLVTSAILQPTCRTTGLSSHFHSQVNYDTWYYHHREYLPHITSGAKVPVMQADLQRMFLRGQPIGTWVDEIAPLDDTSQTPGHLQSRS